MEMIMTKTERLQELLSTPVPIPVGLRSMEIEELLTLTPKENNALYPQWKQRINHQIDAVNRYYNKPIYKKVK